jgi:uncharacterized protein (TIGR03083 family)
MGSPAGSRSATKRATKKFDRARDRMTRRPDRRDTSCRARGALAKLRTVNVWTAEPLDLREPLREERRDLLDLLAGLEDEEWMAPSPCAGWRVKDVVSHLLDDDLGWLSRDRDDDLDGLIPMELDYRDFVDALNQRNQRWVDATGGLSRRLMRELLAWTGERVAAYHDTVSLTEPAGVIWAGGQVPGWLGLGRDLTERWVHQQQIREAVGSPGGHHRYLPAVLSVFVWAFPQQYQPQVDTGTVVNLEFGPQARWHLIRRDHGWELEDGQAGWPAADITADMDSAWRQLTGASTPLGAVTTDGPAHLAQPLLDVRSIIV